MAGLPQAFQCLANMVKANSSHGPVRQFCFLEMEGHAAGNGIYSELNHHSSMVSIRKAAKHLVIDAKCAVGLSPGNFSGILEFGRLAGISLPELKLQKS